MKRKLIRQGVDAITITLPREWVKKHNLQAGAEVNLAINEAQLVISTEKNLEHKKTSLHFSQNNKSVQRFLLANAYRSDFEEIEITYEKSSQLSEIQLLLEELLGIEITSQKEKSVTLSCVAIPDSQQYPLLFRRIFHIIDTAFEYILEDGKTGNFNPAKMDLLQKNLLRLSNFCSRVVHNHHIRIKDRAFPEYVLLKLADYYISELRYLYSQFQSKQSDLLLGYVSSCRHFFGIITHAVFKQELQQVEILLLEKEKLFKLKDKLILKVQPLELKLIQEVSILLRLLTVSIGPITTLILTNVSHK